MSALDIATGEIVAHMSATSARQLTDEIRSNLTVAYDKLVDAFKGRADLALGYESWDAYCAAEFSEARMLRPTPEQRREIVASMRSEGMSQRAIGSALGVAQDTVSRDLASERNRSDDQPDTVTSLDGRQRPATQPPRAQGLPPEGTPTDDGEVLADPRPVDGEPADLVVEDDPTPAPSVHDDEAEPQQRKQRQASRRPLTTFAKDAGWDLRKTVERVERIFADDRFGRNKEEVATHLRGHLTYTVETLQGLLDQLTREGV